MTRYTDKLRTIQPTARGPILITDDMVVTIHTAVTAVYGDLARNVISHLVAAQLVGHDWNATPTTARAGMLHTYTSVLSQMIVYGGNIKPSSWPKRRTLAELVVLRQYEQIEVVKI